MHPTPLSGLVVVLLIAEASVWVLQDARSRTARGRPVVATLAGSTIEKPEVWAALCLVVVVFFLPVYLVARSAG